MLFVLIVSFVLSLAHYVPIYLPLHHGLSSNDISAGMCFICKHASVPLLKMFYTLCRSSGAKDGKKLGGAKSAPPVDA